MVGRGQNRSPVTATTLEPLVNRPGELTWESTPGPAAVVDDLAGRMAHASRLIDEEPRRVPGRPDAVSRLERLCSVLTRVLPATGVGLSLLTDAEHNGGTVAASDARTRVLEELQFSLGEGPGIDAYAARRPVLSSDLDRDGFLRWPAYTPAVLQHGVRAIFAFPLQVGAARAGALDVYRTEAGPLTAEALIQAVTFAELAMGYLVDGQARTDDSLSSRDVDDALANRLEVYQAQGMVMVDLGVGIGEAMARLRAHSYADGRSIAAVAQDIVAGRLTLDRDR